MNAACPVPVFFDWNSAKEQAGGTCPDPVRAHGARPDGKGVRKKTVPRGFRRVFPRLDRPDVMSPGFVVDAPHGVNTPRPSGVSGPFAMLGTGQLTRAVAGGSPAPPAIRTGMRSAGSTAEGNRPGMIRPPGNSGSAARGASGLPGCA